MFHWIVPATLLMLLAGAAMPAGAAEIVKCTRADGSVVYTQAPCPSDSEAEKLDIQSNPDPEASKRAAERRKAFLEEAEEREKEARKKAEASAREKELRRKKCEQARKNRQQLATARRFSQGEGENRRYLSAEEIDERKRVNRERIAEYCGN